MEAILKSDTKVSEGFNELFHELSKLHGLKYSDYKGCDLIWNSYYRFIEHDNLLITWIKSKYNYPGYPPYSVSNWKIIIWKDSSSKFCKIVNDDYDKIYIHLVDKQNVNSEYVEEYIPEKFRSMNGDYTYCKYICDCTFGELINLIN